jgi:hypothetical protein
MTLVRVRPLNSKEILEAHKRYLLGSSLSQVAKYYKVSRQRLWGAFNRMGLSTRPLRAINEDVVTIDGFNFTPDKDGYYRRTTSPRLQLHRYLWERDIGEIPEGYVLKSKDGDKKNYSPNNYTLIKWRF